MLIISENYDWESISRNFSMENTFFPILTAFPYPIAPFLCAMYIMVWTVNVDPGGSGGSAERAKTVGSGGTRSGGAPSRTSGSSGGSTATATATASPHHQPTQTDTTDRQSFRMAMGNPCMLQLNNS